VLASNPRPGTNFPPFIKLIMTLFAGMKGTGLKISLIDEMNSDVYTLGTGRLRVYAFYLVCMISSRLGHILN